jgi:hypothetical protein
VFKSTHTADLHVGENSGTTPVLVRPAHEDDVAQIVEMNRTTDRFQMSTYTNAASPEELLYWVGDTRSIFIVATVDKKILGYAQGVCISPRWFFFDALVVEPSLWAR